MKLAVAAGTTDYTILVWIGDSSSAIGAGKTALVAANLTAYYARVEADNDVTSAVLTLSDLSALTDAHSDGGLLEVDATNQPGLYRLDLSDAVLATGAWSAVLTIIDAGSNDVAPVNIEIQLEPVPANVTAMATDVIAGAALAASAGTEIANAILDLTDGVETGVTLRQALQRMGATTGGTSRGAGSGTETFTGQDDATDRVQFTTDSVGNRTGVNYDP